jgi:hypothetical protein
MKTIKLIANLAITETALKIYAVIMSALFLTLWISSVVRILI